MDSILIEMITIYKPEGIDWMNCSLQRKNPYTFHHIQEARNGGKRTVSNGAIITSNAHQYLNFLDFEYHRIYLDLNYLFKELNNTMLPPAEDYFEEVDYILKKAPKKSYRRR